MVIGTLEIEWLMGEILGYVLEHLANLQVQDSISDLAISFVFSLRKQNHLKAISVNP